MTQPNDFFARDEDGDTLLVTPSSEPGSVIVVTHRPVRLSYAEALRLHTFLGEHLGLSTPRPSAPLTASRASASAHTPSGKRLDLDARFSVTGTDTDPDQ